MQTRQCAIVESERLMKIKVVRQEVRNFFRKAAGTCTTELLMVIEIVLGSFDPSSIRIRAQVR